MNQQRSPRSFRSAHRSNSGGGGLREKINRFKHRPPHDEKKARRSPSPAYTPNPLSSAYYFSANQVTPRTNDAPASRSYVYNDRPDEKMPRNDYAQGKTLPVASPYYKCPPQDVPGPSDYERFYWKCEDMLGELSRLKFALHTVGASGPGIQAIDAVILSFKDLRKLFGNNTYSLYPHDARLKSLQTRSDAYLVRFSRSLERVSDALEMTEKALREFRGVFYDESTIYLLVCLKKRFKSEAGKTAVGRGHYVNSLPEDSKKKIQALLRAFLEKAVEELRKHFSKYCDKGVPVISSSQGMKTSRYLDLTTIATFLSGVTASMLQLSSDDTNGAVAIGVNTFLFSSLVFSIASAINSLLVMAWRKSVVREPNSYMPLWISTCLNTGPMISLVISVAFFAVGICLFVFSSSQHIVTTAVTVSFAGFHTMCLLLLAIWLIFEKWKFRKVAGSVGQDLTGDSLSLTILDWIIYWPEKLNSVVRPGGAIEASQLEPGKRAPGGASYATDRPHAVWDDLSNNFLSGTNSNLGRSTFGPPTGSRTGRGRMSSRSEVAAPIHYEGESRYNDEPIVPIVGDQGAQVRIPPPISTPEAVYGDYERPDPTEIDYNEGGLNSETHPMRRQYEETGYTPHFEDEEYEDDAYARPATPETPQPVIMQAPPVESQTYETALFLPRNEEGDFEDVESSSKSNESGRYYPDVPASPTIVPPNFAGLPPPIIPSSHVPNPMATSYSERVMVIPTNPPTYVVPPGSYVAYGTQPNIGPSTQAGNFSVYNPGPSIPWGVSAMPIVVPSTPFIPPAPHSPYQGPIHDLPDVNIRIPERSAMNYGREESESGPRISTRRRGDSYSDLESNRYEATQYNSRQPTIPSRPRSWDRMREYTPQSTTQLDRHPRQYVYPRPSQQRRTSTGSTQVRFGPPVTIPPPRASTDIQSGYSEARSTTTSFLDGSLTTEPEQIEEIVNDNPGDREESTVSYGRPFVTTGPSRLDVLQRRPRRTTSSSYYNDARSQPSTRSRTEESAPPRSIVRHERAPDPQGDMIGEPLERSRRSSQSADLVIRPPAPQNSADHDQPHASAVMSTIEEATRSSMTVDSDHNSDSSDRSAKTAQETMPGAGS